MILKGRSFHHEIHSENRRDVLTKIDHLVSRKFYDPTFRGRDWPSLVQTHRERIVGHSERSTFEDGVNEMLGLLGSSGLGLVSPRTRINSKNAMSATLHHSETEYGHRWVFQDVPIGGPAASSGIKTGDVLISVGGCEFNAPETRPVFAMGQSHDLVIEKPSGRTRVTIAIPAAKHAENPCAVPDPLTAELSGSVAVVRIPLFPGELGIDFAARISQVFDSVLPAADRLVVDLRGNPGGGLGCLRLMSLLTPGEKPIGFSVDRAAAEHGYDRTRFPRFGRIPRSKVEVPWLAMRFVGRKSVVLVTEGLGARSFHNRVVVLVNEHTTCAAEMVALFAREETGAKIVGTETPGRLISHTGFNVGHGFTLALPVAAYLSWAGTGLDGIGISPDQVVDWSYPDARRGVDTQLSAAVRIAEKL